MYNPINTINSSVLSVQNNQVITTSLEVSNAFGRQHSHILEKLKIMECSKEFLAVNFSTARFENRGKEYISYNMTKDGFMFLVMGFTGKKAARVKEAYINIFNQMEKRLSNDHEKKLKSASMPPTRVLISLDEQGQQCSQIIPNDAFIATSEDSPKIINYSSDIKSEMLQLIIDTCVDKLVTRAKKVH